MIGAPELIGIFKAGQAVCGNLSFGRKVLKAGFLPLKFIFNQQNRRGGQMQNLPARRFGYGSNGAASGGLARRQGQGFVPASTQDRALQDNIQALARSKQELAGINNLLKQALDLPSDRKRGLLAKFVHAVMPKSFYEVMPESLVKLVAEEYDVLELIERLMRTNIDNIQDAEREIAACVIQKRQDLNELESDIETAQKENWSAQELQQYMAERAGIDVYDIVAQLLDQEFNALLEEEKERRKQDLLGQLRSIVAVGESFMETAGSVCSAGLQVFHQATGQYFSYVNFARPVAVIRDAAQTMVDLNHSMYAAQDALKATIECSLRAIEVSVDAAEMINKYSIASADMKGLFEAGKRRLEEKLKQLKASSAKTRVLASVERPALKAAISAPETSAQPEVLAS